jgi:hypothetical protein
MKFDFDPNDNSNYVVDELIASEPNRRAVSSAGFGKYASRDWVNGKPFEMEVKLKTRRAVLPHPCHPILSTQTFSNQSGPSR